MSHSTTLLLCYFNCCYFEEWCFSKFYQGCSRRMDELWIIYHLCGNTLSVCGMGVALRCTSPFLLRHTLIGDWWRGIFHHASTSSCTPSLGLPLSPVHGALDEYDWQRWSPHAVTNYFSQWLPSWWINVYCVSRTDPPPLPWDERRVRPDLELCGMHSLDNYFHRWIPLQAGWWSGHLRSETIACKHGAGSLSLPRNLILHRPESLVSVQLLLHTYTHALSFSIRC